MNERELGSAMRTAVLDEPPLVFDADRLMTKADRESKRRVLTLSAAGGVIAVALAVPTLLGLGGGTAVQTAAPAPGPTPRDCGGTADCFPDPPVAIKEKGQELGRTLQTMLDGVAPGTKLEPGSPSLAGNPGLEGTTFDYSHPTFLSVAMTPGSTIRSGWRLVVVVDSPAKPKVTPQSFCARVADSPSSCHDVVNRADGGASFVSGASAVDVRADGVEVTATTYRNDLAETGTGPVGLAQLRQLATDPGLTLAAG